MGNTSNQDNNSGVRLEWSILFIERGSLELRLYFDFTDEVVLFVLNIAFQFHHTLRG